MVLSCLSAHQDFAVACSPPEETFEEIVADATVILRGRIVQVTLVRTPDYEVLRMTVEAYAYWKDPSGELAPVVEIYSPTASGCGLDPRVGEIMTFTCWNNALGWGTGLFCSWSLYPLYPLALKISSAPHCGSPPT